MNTKNFFIAESIVCLIFGITLTFMADYLGKEYFTDPTWINDGTKVVAAGYGTLLFTCGIAYFSMRNAGPSLGRRTLLMLACVSNHFLIIVHIVAILSNIETSFAWGTVALCVVFGAWSLRLLFKERALEA